jgi:hypothetical protein
MGKCRSAFSKEDMSMAKYLVSLCLVLGIGLGASIFFAFRSNPAVPVSAKQETALPKSDVSAQKLPSDVPAVSPASPELLKPSTVSWSTPDGKKHLNMRTEYEATGRKLYSFSVSNSASESGELVYQKTLDGQSTMTIPFNAWSPDNKHFFVQKHNPDMTHNYVFKVNGAAFPDDEQHIDVNTVFAEKNTEFTLDKVTGWAAPGLLMVKSKTTENTVGPTYWFDINRKSLIRLAPQF